MAFSLLGEESGIRLPDILLAKPVSGWLVGLAALVALSCAFSHAFINADPDPRVCVAFATELARGLAFFAAAIMCASHD